MEPHQARVIAEKKDLDGRAVKLSDFIGNNPLFEKIDPEEQERLKEQCETMWELSEILGKRIAAFNLSTDSDIQILTDAERLDWLEEKKASLVYEDDGESLPHVAVYLLSPSEPVSRGIYARVAIDAAIRKA